MTLEPGLWSLHLRAHETTNRSMERGRLLATAPPHILRVGRSAPLWSPALAWDPEAEDKEEEEDDDILARHTSRRKVSAANFGRLSVSGEQWFGGGRSIELCLVTSQSCVF